MVSSAAIDDAYCRNREQAEAWAAIERGAGAILIGVPGAGTSLLLRRLALEAQGAGRVAVRLHGATVPGGADHAALRRCDVAWPDGAAPPAETVAATLARMLVEDRERTGQPAVLLVDDGHLLDLASLDWLIEVAVRGDAVLVLAKPPAATLSWGVDHPARVRMRYWSAVSGAPAIHLRALDREAVHALIRALASDDEVSPLWREVIYRQSAGLPALVASLVEDGRRRGRFRTPPGRDAAVEDLPPAGTTVLLRPRLEQLDEEARAALIVLSRLDGVPLERAQLAVPRRELTVLLDSELIDVVPGDGVHASAAAADVAATLVGRAVADAASASAADALMRHAPESARRGSELTFLAESWLAEPSAERETLADRYGREAVRAVLVAAAREATTAGHGQRALEILSADRAGAADARFVIETARANTALHRHDLAREELARAEGLIRELRDARSLLNVYRDLMVWHLRDHRAFDTVTARAAQWLDDPRWEREAESAAIYPQQLIRRWVTSCPAQRADGFGASEPAVQGYGLAVGAVAMALGDRFGEADELLAECAAVLDRPEATAAVHHALFALRCAQVAVGLLRGEADAAITAAIGRAAMAVGIGGSASVHQLASFVWLSALAALSAGDAQRALAMLSKVDARALPEGMAVWLDAERVQALARTGDVLGARRGLRRLTALASGVEDDWLSFALARAHLAVLRAQGLDERAEATARLLAERIRPLSPVLARVLLAADARAGAAADDREGGDRKTDDPGVDASRIAAPSGNVTALRAVADDRLDGGLTEREFLVARLVVAGRSNAEIAAELFLSVRTVESHLHHARVKLGVSGREGLLQALGGIERLPAIADLVPEPRQQGA